MVEFSPTEALGQTIEVVTKNMEEMERLQLRDVPGRPHLGARESPPWNGGLPKFDPGTADPVLATLLWVRDPAHRRG